MVKDRRLLIISKSLVLKRIREITMVVVDPIKVSIIGLGSIGMLNDHDNNAKQKISKNHLSAFLKNPNFQLVSCCDKDPKIINDFQTQHSLPIFNDYKIMLSKYRPEVVVVSVNTEYLVEVTLGILEIYTPNLILIEKPISYEASQAKILEKRAKDLNAKILVNYSRRANPDFRLIKNKLIRKNSLNLMNGYAYYSGGFINNASHIIDLSKYYFGEVKSFRKISCHPISDYDYKVSVELNFSNCRFNIVPSILDNSTIFNFQIATKNSLITYDFDSKLLLENHKNIFRRLLRAPKFRKFDVEVDQLHTTHEIENFIKSQSSNLTCLKEGVATLELIETIILS